MFNFPHRLSLDHGHFLWVGTGTHTNYQMEFLTLGFMVLFAEQLNAFANSTELLIVPVIL